MRLIDAEAMRESIRVEVQGAESLALKHELQKWVDGQPTVCDWISVEDRLPEKSDYFIVYKNDGRMAVARFQSRGKRTHWGKGNCKITHWMPLPEPPEEVSMDD